MRAAREAEIEARKGNKDKIWETNRAVSLVAAPQLEARERAFRAFYEEIQFDGLLRGEAEAVDAFLDFLDVDVLAWRCARLKEKGLRCLKQAPLNPRQIRRLQQLALIQIERQGNGLTDFSRLMIRLANREWMETLEEKIANSSGQTQGKARRMSGVVLNSRTDLR